MTEQSFEMVIGIETHVELNTRTKVFCGCRTDYGMPPNTQCCPVCMGLPGAMPTLNKEVVHHAVLTGLATGCRINHHSAFDRKNYFYPDLPKAYQITQFYKPICEQGHVMIETAQGTKRIGITRIHIEEDAGKLNYLPDGRAMVDHNRCGVPLLEIVSEPDLRSAEEAVAYLKTLRTLLLYAGISDCRMNEGSFRADVNLSVHKPGTPFGTRTEMKNLNSFQSVQQAIEAEYRRQVERIRAGEAILQETRRFSQKTRQTYAMRSKEELYDYRYFAEPDLPPVLLDDAQIAGITAELPELPDARKSRYVAAWGIKPATAGLIVSDKTCADYFEQTTALTKAPVTLANLMVTEVFRLMGDTEDGKLQVSPTHLAALADMMDSREVSSSAAKTILTAIWVQDADPRTYAEQHQLLQQSDEAQLKAWVQQALREKPELAERYRAGKLNVIKALVGAVMKLSGGAANPALAQSLIEDCLKMR